MLKTMFRWLTPINRYTVSGIILLIFGFILLPLLIGFPILIFGWLQMTFGIFYYYLELFPAGREIIENAKAYLRKYFNFYKKLFKEVLRKK